MEIEGPVEAVLLVKPDGKRFIRPFVNCGTGPAEHVGFHACRGKLRLAGFEVEYIGTMAGAVERLLATRSPVERLVRAAAPAMAVS
ncbi:MAG: hypothetical protein AMJ59_10870 [Gammaproteobacteria bacterium SG8_31]|jgi:hypothetical protein|nr:MAG: hypothetical protein AMJ59_10870 [Gammaproteobacteria bacterium SG8_31]